MSRLLLIGTMQGLGFCFCFSDSDSSGVSLDNPGTVTLQFFILDVLIQAGAHTQKESNVYEKNIISSPYRVFRFYT